MKSLLVILAILAIAIPATAREIEGAYVQLVSPTSVDPGGSYTFMFWVQNDSDDAEWLVDIHITFPGDFDMDEASMGFTEIATGRPSFDMTCVDNVAAWEDNDGGYGEIYSLEGTDLWIDGTVGGPGRYILYWEIWGDGYGDEPHYVDGEIELGVTAVEEATWSSIKAMYR